jgi:hypothetical protein
MGCLEANAIELDEGNLRRKVGVSGFSKKIRITHSCKTMVSELHTEDMHHSGELSVIGAEGR